MGTGDASVRREKQRTGKKLGNTVTVYSLVIFSGWISVALEILNPTDR